MNKPTDFNAPGNCAASCKATLFADEERCSEGMEFFTVRQRIIVDALNQQNAAVVNGTPSLGRVAVSRRLNRNTLALTTRTCTTRKHRQTRARARALTPS